jgi:hypothetical protein
MTTVATLLAQKQMLLDRLQEAGPHERDEIVLNLLDEAGPGETSEEQ